MRPSSFLSFGGSRHRISCSAKPVLHHGGLQGSNFVSGCPSFTGLAILAVFAFITNLVVGQFHPGFVKQPVAHTMSLWNFGGMVLAGLAFP